MPSFGEAGDAVVPDAADDGSITSPAGPVWLTLTVLFKPGVAYTADRRVDVPLREPFFENIEIAIRWPHTLAVTRAFHHPACEAITLDGLLHALADPVRRGIVRKLAASPGLHCAGGCPDLAPSTVSFHYRVLREAGLIRSEKQGVSVISTLRHADVEQRFPGLLTTILAQPESHH